MVLHTKKVHIIMLRKMESMVDELCERDWSPRQSRSKESDESEITQRRNTLLYRIRWIMYLFTIFVTDREAQMEKGRC